MATENLTIDEALVFFCSYRDSLTEALNQYNNGEDTVPLRHTLATIRLIVDLLEIQSSSKYSWKIMTAITGVPHVLGSTQAHPLEYDTEHNINQKMESLYNTLLLNHRDAATHDLRQHIKINDKISNISNLLMVACVILNFFIAPWSVGGISFLFPLYSILALPIVIILFASLGISELSRRHSHNLTDMHIKNTLLQVHVNQIPDHHMTMTNRFFQPGNDENGVNMLRRVEESFPTKPSIPT